MKVTIITPCFNSSATIESTLRSVASQSYKNIEHIVIDGFSQDKTREIINSFPHISQWISEKDEGIYDAINKGIELATGDIVGILNADDLFADDQVVARIVKAFSQSGTEIIFADIVFVAYDDLKKKIRHYSSKSFHPRLFRLGFQPAHPTFYTRRENFLKYGNYEKSFKIAGDFELLLRFIKKNRLSFKYIDDVWVKMRVGGVSTNSLNNKIILNKEILRACKLNGLYSNLSLIYIKYMVKWWGFVFKNRG